MDKYPGAANFQNVKILQVIIIPCPLTLISFPTSCTLPFSSVLQSITFLPCYLVAILANGESGGDMK